MQYAFIHQNLLKLKTKIREFEIKYQREPQAVSLLAASKGQSLEKIQAAIQAGQYQFGENYLQEALSKIEQIHHPQVTWHFIGSIQSNKTSAIASHFAWVHTVCSSKVAKRLNDQRPASLPPLNICLEVNISQEASKAGLSTEREILALAQYCLGLQRLRLRGLMAIPAPKASFTEQRAECQKLYVLKEALIKQGLSLDTLSMGMTEDMEAAIAEGATIVRIGRGIFGERA